MRYLLIFLVFCSCSAKTHVKLSSYHLKKAISKGYEVTHDTVYIPDTIIRPQIKTDTAFSVKVDTMYLEKEKVSIRYIRTTDSVYIEAECKADTIIKEIPIAVEKNCPPIPSNDWKWFVYGILILIFMILLNRLFRR